MSNNLQILEFEFEAHAEIVEAEPDNLPSTQKIETVEPKPDNIPTAKKLETMVSELNNISDKVAQEIQQEIRRALPPRVRVEVDLRFYEGSITAIGTVILLFLQPILVEAGKKALEKSFEAGLTRIIQFAVRRILSRHLRGISLSSPLDVDVKPPAENIEDSQAIEDVTTKITPVGPIRNLGYLLPITAANTVLLIVVVIIVSRLLGLLP